MTLPLLALALTLLPQSPVRSVERIWDRAEHNAFTDLCLAEGALYCAFREGTSHVGGLDGVVRVLASADRADWRPVALLAEPGVDLRDPKLARAADGRLVLTMGGSRYEQGELKAAAPRVAFGDPASGAFGPSMAVELPPAARTGFDWLWRVTWHEGRGYGLVYHPRSEEGALDLVVTADGLRYEHVARVAPPLDSGAEARASEATLRFLADGTMLALVRRDGGGARGLLGRAAPPYERFEWRTLDRRLGGPELVVLPDGRWLAGSRAWPPPPSGPGRDLREPWTALFFVEPDGRTRALCALPSGGDTSYPGFALDGETLYVSYYSSHRGQAAIYLATLPLGAL